MKLLELTVENLRDVPNGVHAFGEPSGRARDIVVLVHAAAVPLLETIASLLELVRVPAPAPHRFAWWAGRHGNEEARLRARWALSEGEAALAGLPGRIAVSEWRFDPADHLPRELLVEGALPRGARAKLARHLWVDANEVAVWMGADPLAELLAGIARQGVAATRAFHRPGVGLVGWSMPDTFAGINTTIARIFPALRLERIACEPGESPVACVRGGERVELDQLADAERTAIHLAAAIHTGNVRGGVVLANCRNLPMLAETCDRWLGWLAGLAGTYAIQLIVAAERPGTATSACPRVVELGLFQLSELASVLGVSTDPAQAIQKRSATGEARWPAALTDMLGQNLEVALDPTGLGEQIAGKSSLQDQLDKVLPKIQLCREGDPAAARQALERFCLEGDERALCAVEWLFHENRDNRRSPSMGVRGVLVARRSERGRRTPLMRATDETFEGLRRWLGDKTPEVDVVGQHVNEAIGRQAPGFQTVADLFDALAEGNTPQEPSELRKALEKALTSSSWDPTAARRVASRWRRLRQGAPREREASGTSVLWGLVDLVHRWRADESPTLEEGDKLVLRFEAKTPIEHELRPGAQGAAEVCERLARFLLDKVRAEVFPENGAATPDEAEEDAFHELSFTVERERQRQREREFVGRLRVHVSDAARELWRATCVSPLPRWRLQLDGEVAGGRLLRQVSKAIADKQGTYGVQVTDTVDAAWSAYVRQAAPKGVDMLAQVAPLPVAARSVVEAWSVALQPVVDVASAGSAGLAVAELEAEMGRALDAGDFPRAQELHRHIREARERRPVGADTALAQARSLLGMAAAEIFDGPHRARFLLTPHHPLVLRLRGVEDDMLAGILGGLWAGAWQDESGAELTEAVNDWGLPEPTHAWCAWDGDPLVFEAWLDGGSAVYSRLGASREDDAGSLGCGAAVDVVRRYRDLNPLAADRLRLRIQADRRGEWAESVISELLGRAFAADIDLVTDLSERSMTALEEALVYDRESAEAFELGADGTLPRVRLRRVGDEPAGSAGKHLALVVGEKIDALAAEWHWQPAPAPPAGTAVWDPAVLFDASLPQIAGVVDLVAGPADALSVRAALAMGVAKGSHAGTIPMERQSFDPSRCAAPIVAAQGSAHWLVLASRRPLYRAVQQVGPQVATLLDFQTRLERGRPVHVCISLGARYASHELRGLTARLGDLLGNVDPDLAPALLRRAQKVAPELALRCLGTGGGAELIGLLGLLLAAHWLEEQGGEGLVLALDQHQSLLTGRRRGDLLRVSEVRGAVRVQVCEAKCSTLPLTPDTAPMQHALRQIGATVTGLARLQVQHALSARTRLKLARALVQQAHMLGSDKEGSTQVTRLVELARDPAVDVEVDEGSHVALGFSLGGNANAQKQVATSEVRVFGRAATLTRLEALQRSE